MKKFVKVEQTVEVEVDEAKFTQDFMAEFREVMYPFASLNEHICHLGQLHARGLADDLSFIEGYGPAKAMGIRFRVVDAGEEIVPE